MVPTNAVVNLARRRSLIKGDLTGRRESWAVGPSVPNIVVSPVWISPAAPLSLTRRPPSIVLFRRWAVVPVRSGSGARCGSRPPGDLIRLDHDLVAAVHAGLQQIGRFEHSLIKRNRKFVDSPLEGAGFELSVPREIGFVSRLCRLSGDLSCGELRAPISEGSTSARRGSPRGFS